jgi:phosphate transport system substrate-binding protein
MRFLVCTLLLALAGGFTVGCQQEEPAEQASPAEKTPAEEASPAEATPAAEGSLLIQGSTTVGPIADAFAEAFMRRHPDVTVTVKKTGSGDGAKALVDGQCDIANMSRFMKEKEFKLAVEKGFLPVAHVVAMDGVCVVVHPSNPVQALKGDQVKDMFEGKITNWTEVGGADAEIVLYSRDTSSGTYETFHNLVMKKEKMAPGVEYVASNPDMHKHVSTTRGAIGYVGLGFVDEKIKALEIDGVMPTSRTIASGTYPVARPLFMWTQGFPELGSLTHAFVTFHLTEEGQEIVEARGFIPVTNY